MSMEGLTDEQIERLKKKWEKGWHCPYCGTQYQDKQDAKACERKCSWRFRDRFGRR